MHHELNTAQKKNKEDDQKIRQLTNANLIEVENYKNSIQDLKCKQSIQDEQHFDGSSQLKHDLDKLKKQQDIAVSNNVLFEEKNHKLENKHGQLIIEHKEKLILIEDLEYKNQEFSSESTRLTEELKVNQDNFQDQIEKLTGQVTKLRGYLKDNGIIEDQNFGQGLQMQNYIEDDLLNASRFHADMTMQYMSNTSEKTIKSRNVQIDFNNNGSKSLRDLDTTNQNYFNARSNNVSMRYIKEKECKSTECQTEPVLITETKIKVNLGTQTETKIKVIVGTQTDKTSQMMDNQAKIMQDQAIKIDGQAIEINSQAKKIDGQAKQFNDQAIKIKGQAIVIYDQAIEIDGQAKKIEDQALKNDGQAILIESQVIKIDGQVKKIDDQGKEVINYRKELDKLLAEKYNNQKLVVNHAEIRTQTDEFVNRVNHAEIRTQTDEFVNSLGDGKDFEMQTEKVKRFCAQTQCEDARAKRLIQEENKALSIKDWARIITDHPDRDLNLDCKNEGERLVNEYSSSDPQETPEISDKLKQKYNILCKYSRELKDEYDKLHEEYRERVLYYIDIINQLNDKIMKDAKEKKQLRKSKDRSSSPVSPDDNPFYIPDENTEKGSKTSKSDRSKSRKSDSHKKEEPLMPVFGIKKDVKPLNKNEVYKPMEKQKLKKVLGHRSVIPDMYEQPKTEDIANQQINKYEDKRQTRLNEKSLVMQEMLDISVIHEEDDNMSFDDGKSKKTLAYSISKSRLSMMNRVEQEVMDDLITNEVPYRHGKTKKYAYQKADDLSNFSTLHADDNMAKNMNLNSSLCQDSNINQKTGPCSPEMYSTVQVKPTFDNIETDKKYIKDDVTLASEKHLKKLLETQKKKVTQMELKYNSLMKHYKQLEKDIKMQKENCDNLIKKHLDELNNVTKNIQTSKNSAKTYRDLLEKCATKHNDLETLAILDTMSRISGKTYGSEINDNQKSISLADNLFYNAKTETTTYNQQSASEIVINESVNKDNKRADINMKREFAVAMTGIIRPPSKKQDDLTKSNARTIEKSEQLNKNIQSQNKNIIIYESPEKKINNDPFNEEIKSPMTVYSQKAFIQDKDETASRTTKSKNQKEKKPEETKQSFFGMLLPKASGKAPDKQDNDDRFKKKFATIFGIKPKENNNKTNDITSMSNISIATKTKDKPKVSFAEAFKSGLKHAKKTKK